MWLTHERLQSGYSTISIDASGSATQSTSTEVGNLFSLNPNGAVYSSFVGDATCLYVGFSSNYSTVDAFVTTKTNFDEMFDGTTLDYGKVNSLPAATWKSNRSASAILATNTTQTYVFVIINTGGQAQNGSLNAATTVGYRFAVYDKSASSKISS